MTRRRRWPYVLAALAVAFAALIVAWRSAIARNRSIPDEPFRVAGNLYYVGATGVTSFLVTGPEGHVLIDGGYPETAPLIIASIEKLGFGRFPAPRVDRRFADGAVVRVGPVQLTAHVTAGHTRGCTSWSIPLQEGTRELLAVSVCSLSLLPFTSLVDSESYPGIRADFERSFRTLRALQPDIFLASHGSFFDLGRKRRARATAADSVAPFIDPQGYERYIERAERRVRDLTAKQSGKGGG